MLHLIARTSPHHNVQHRSKPDSLLWSAPVLIPFPDFFGVREFGYLRGRPLVFFRSAHESSAQKASSDSASTDLTDCTATVTEDRGSESIHFGWNRCAETHLFQRLGTLTRFNCQLISSKASRGYCSVHLGPNGNKDLAPNNYRKRMVSSSSPREHARS